MTNSEVYKRWVQQCRAASGIRQRFGLESALSYLVGEKLVNLSGALMRQPELKQELPRIQRLLWRTFRREEIIAYAQGLRKAVREDVQRLLCLS